MRVDPWLIAIRPHTLPASISPVALGSALALYDAQFSLVVFLLALLCALSLQIAVNIANDLSDAHSGVDTSERLGPIRVTQSGLISETKLKRVLAGILLIAVASGLTLVYLSSWWMLSVGLICLIAVFAYSAGPWPLASLGLGELSVFLFFGLLAVGGSYYLQTGELTYQVIGFASAAGLISAAIMLVNNIRDRVGDARAAKNTLAVRLGDVKARRLYQLLVVSGLSLHLIVSVKISWLLAASVLACFPLSYRLISEILHRKGEALNRQLQQTALLELIYCGMTSVILVALRLT